MVAEAVHRAEELGVDSIWTWDHFFAVSGDPAGGTFECWTLLTAIASLSSRAQVGSLVSCAAWRNPALLSAMAKTIDHVSAGRLVVGLGAGWDQDEFEEYGYSFGTPQGRLRDLAAGLATMRHRWETDNPKPVNGHIPVLLGGTGNGLLELVAQYATMWHGFSDALTPEASRVRQKSAVLERHCAAISRDPQEIERCMTTPPNHSDEVRTGYRDLGITHFMLNLPRKPGTTEWNFDEVERLVQWREKANR
jgi:probable F420-dependent oxidoreductase